MAERVRCRFYIRRATQPPSNLFRYIYVVLPQPNGVLSTPYPPVIGDTIFLSDREKQTGGYFRVIERSWHHPAYGSVDFPVLRSVPDNGPLLDIVVEEWENIMANEAPRAESK